MEIHSLRPLTGSLVLAALVAAVPLASQVPEGWNQHRPLGSEGPGSAGTWWGAGLWAGEAHGPATPMVDAMGLGSGLSGAGFHLEGGHRLRSWDLAAEVLGNRDPQGRSYLTLYRGHAWWRGQSGWQAGFEQEPLTWGYGLNGGYLMSEAARPVPKLRVESPMRPLSLWNVPLGTWGFQAFLGRLENDRQLSPLMQDLAWRRQAIANAGDPQAPLLTGYRLQAQFGPKVEFYANYTNLFAGTLKGVGMTDGYGTGDYLTAMFGLKDALAESHIDFTDPNRPAGDYRNKGRSGSNADVGVRVRVSALERMLDAEDVRVYFSRGSKGVTMTYSLFLHRPFYWLGKDAERDGRNLLQGHPKLFWYENQRKSSPNMVVPNDTVGILMKWPGLRVGLEYQDTSNTEDQGHRSFAHGIYLTGFYTHGDPLGNAIGGEARTFTFSCEADLLPTLKLATWVHLGDRLFRDDPTAWQGAHPGAAVRKDRTQEIQQNLAWQFRPSTTLSLGAAWMRHGAVDFVAGRSGNGFRWYADLAYRWGRD